MSGPPAEVVLVHGLWFGAWSMGVLDRRLSRAGFATRRFRYRSTRAGLDAHAAELRRFAGQASSEMLHFVAHSLGGLLVLKMLADSDALPPGRIVLLGSPLAGSAVARRATAIPGGSRLLGQARPALEQGFSRVCGDRPTGLIAGSRPLGLGVLIGVRDGAGDGTVAVRETLAEGLAEHLVLPVTHTGMLFSRAVAGQTVHFLRSGSFAVPS